MSGSFFGHFEKKKTQAKKLKLQKTQSKYVFIMNFKVFNDIDSPVLGQC